MIWLVACLSAIGAGLALVWVGREIRKERPDG